MPLPDDRAEPPTTDRIFDLLGDGERRRAIAALRESDGSVDLDELAEATAARVEGVDPAEVSPDRRERAATMLHHAHLPKLEAANVAEYDSAAGEVELTTVADALDPYFEVIEEYGDE